MPGKRSGWSKLKGANACCSPATLVAKSFVKMRFSKPGQSRVAGLFFNKRRDRRFHSLLVSSSGGKENSGKRRCAGANLDAVDSIDLPREGGGDIWFGYTARPGRRAGRSRYLFCISRFGRFLLHNRSSAPSEWRPRCERIVRAGPAFR